MIQIAANYAAFKNPSHWLGFFHMLRCCSSFVKSTFASANGLQAHSFNADLLTTTFSRVCTYGHMYHFWKVNPRRSKHSIDCSDFFAKNQSSLMPLRLLYRKRSRSRQFAVANNFFRFLSTPQKVFFVLFFILALNR